MQRSLRQSIHSTVPDLASLLSACSCLSHIRQTHAFMIHRGFDHDNLFLSRFIDACTSLGFPNYGYSLFAHKPQPNTRLCNTAIRALSLSPSPPSATDALRLFNGLRSAGLRPDTYSFPFVMKAVLSLSSIDVGREIHCQAVGSGLGCDVHVGTALVEMYSKLGCVLEARKVFDEMALREVALWNAMVVGYAKAGDMGNSRDLFEKMTQRNVISWTALITGYAQMGRSSEALAVFWRMLQVKDRVKPDEVAMLAALSACADLGALESGKWIHSYIDKHGLSKTIALTNTLIDMYAKSGNIEKALDLFENTDHQTVVTWTTIIDGLAWHGLWRQALEMFSRMGRAKFQPNEITFIAILSACSHVGLLEIGLGCFNLMGSKYAIEPRIEHYGCVIDLLGRAGLLGRALDLVMKMPFEANGAIWGSLLAASRLHGKAELAEFALHRLVEVEPHNSGNYMLLSSVYAAVGRWNKAGMARKVMRDNGIQKTAGWSSIEVNSNVHEFIAGDMSHPQSERAHELLDLINYQLKMIGSLPLECGVAA